MSPLQQLVIALFTLFSAIFGLIAFYQCKYKNNANGLTLYLFIVGSFVWADQVVFGLFWTIVGVVCLAANDWILFLLCVSLFWLVRSIGETIYWFNQQFSTIKRNPPEQYWIYKIFHNDSVWFVYQITHQCMIVVTVITSVYLFSLWLQ